MYALAHSHGPRLAGAFIRNVQTALTSPDADATVTGSTPSLQARPLDPFQRNCSVLFELDRITTFGSPSYQASAGVPVQGWPDVPAAWGSMTPLANGLWYWRAKSSVGLGGAVGFTSRYSPVRAMTIEGGAGIPRSLYLYVAKIFQTEIPAVGDNARSLYLYVNKSVRNYLDKPYARSLYLYVNKVFINEVEARSLALYANVVDGEVFPYLNHLRPEEQYVGGQVELFGDGFGQYLDATQLPTSLTVSSVNGGQIADFVRDGTAAQWESTSGAAAWIRFTFSATKRIYGIVLEGPINGTSWGIPRFRFSDASQEDGTVTVPNGATLYRSTEHPVGTLRHLYVLSAPKDTDYVEVAIASGGSGTNRGLAEAWILEEAVPKEAAETSRAVLNLGLPSEQTMGIVLWSNRSPNLWPANSGVPLLSAATVTVPTGAVSGLVYVEEST